MKVTCINLCPDCNHKGTQTGRHWPPMSKSNLNVGKIMCKKMVTHFVDFLFVTVLVLALRRPEHYILV